jgi:hypothetical protein
VTDTFAISFTVPADIRDHDLLSGNPTSKSWPKSTNSHASQLIHFHFCELIHAWNLNPFRRIEARGVAAVDELAEERGESLFSFTSKEGRDDFIGYYGLEDFVLPREDKGNTPFRWLRLANQFALTDINAFMTTYRNAMMTLSIIHDERLRAIKNDGNKVGFLMTDHFCARELHELMRIRQAREKLGAGFIERL